MIKAVRPNITFVFVLLVSSLSASMTFFSCTENSPHASRYSIHDSDISNGKKLAQLYCGSCHLLPDPALLNKKGWARGVLPGMAPRLGIFFFNGEEYPSARKNMYIGRSFYPSKPLLDDHQWQQVLDYYYASAPDSLQPITRTGKFGSAGRFFQPSTPVTNFPEASSCFVKFDTTGATPSLLLGTANSPALFRYDQQLKQKDSLPTTGPIVDMDISSKAVTVCNIGILNPNDARKGSVGEWSPNTFAANRKTTPTQLFDSLARPVQTIRADLNGDHRDDYLVCEFGNLKGALSWMENKGKGNFTRHVLRGTPGAIKAYVQDYNHDGLPDIWALFAQGDESLVLYTNKGNGNFEEQTLLRFPPIYGSTYFELHDFNKDGFPDILYTCGDNADYSPVLKPYHGIYIFLNDGRNHFKQQWFFPMNGCFKAMARDFDGDGDLDIAAISFFADYKHHPEEGFFYLENKGDFNFQADTLTPTIKGHWLTMDVAPFSRPGAPDIVLGNFTFGNPLRDSAGSTAPPFLVLRNRSTTPLH